MRRFELEGCAACHEPHGSANPRMLTRHGSTVRVPGVPRQSGGPNPRTRTALGVVPPAFHDLRSRVFRTARSATRKSTEATWTGICCDEDAIHPRGAGRAAARSAACGGASSRDSGASSRCLPSSPRPRQFPRRMPPRPLRPLRRFLRTRIGSPAPSIWDIAGKPEWAAAWTPTAV